MQAITQLDALDGISGDIPLAQPMYPIGTKIDLSKIVGEDRAYFQRKIRKVLIQRLRKTLNSLQKQGYLKEMRGKKMLSYNKDQLRAAFCLMAEADSVEVAGYAPCGMHTVGFIANQCYIQGGTGFSGTSYSYYFMFRKTDEEGRKLVYIYPEPLMRESSVSRYLLGD